MLYKAKNAVSIRQVHKPKWQIGQLTIPAGVSQEQAVTLAQKVVPVLESDPSLEEREGERERERGEREIYNDMYIYVENATQRF